MAVTYRSSPLTTMPGKYCCFCAQCKGEISEDCEAEIRLHEHCRNIAYIVSECPGIVKLLIGPDEIEMTCQKAALGFYSDFFEAAFYGGMAETAEEVNRLPEETKPGIATFVSWIYSGQVHSPVSAEELWILGDRLGSPTFCNDVMHFLFGLYGSSTDCGGRWLSARSLELIHGKTIDNSKLMLFAYHTLKVCGPLCPRAIADESQLGEGRSYEQDWHDLIKRGGYLVLAIALNKSICEDLYEDPEYNEYDDPECSAPWKLSNQKKYLFLVTQWPIAEYIVRKKRSSKYMGRKSKYGAS